MVLFTSRSLITWEKSPDTLPGVSPQVFAYYPLLTINSLHLYRNHMMTKFTFFLNRAVRWKRDLASLWGNFNVCPCLDHLEFPCHSPAELSSVSSFKVWRNTQEPCHDIAYLLVHMGSINEGRKYGISLVWVNPKQIRASTMVEAVETLAAYPSSGTDWSHALAQLYKSSHHVPIPKDKHLGILPQGKAEETSCVQISQLYICQLLSTGPQVVYPSGLNGHDEPVITTLPETAKQWYKHYCQQASLSGDQYLSQGGVRHQGTAYW